MNDLIRHLRDAFASELPPSEASLGYPPANDSAQYPIWRLLSAWKDASDNAAPLGPDHAVLLRQAARWSDSDGLFVGRLPEPLVALGRTAGFTLGADGILRSSPYVPSWLDADQLDPARGLDPRPELRRPHEAVPAEGYLARFGFGAWQSLAQKEAVWTTITAPPGATVLAGLPTGAGKSLCFQLLARTVSGLTVVVVPTVALAIDQYRSAQRLFESVPQVSPMYYASGDPNCDPSSVIEAVASGTTRLLFTSPESVASGRLRAAITDAAARGDLSALVIDEAHMVDTWGAYFRVDFQVLAASRRQWKTAAALRGSAFRTLLLSATVTPSCRDLLRLLYCEEGTEWREVVSQRLRPEMTYFGRRFASAHQQRTALLDALWHLPRPAIVYTTEVESANEVAATLRNAGFRRLGCFTGDTPGLERRALVDGWRTNQIDLMVATSAFGMGVDKSDVRTVIHACCPEDLHRYYQEVGRGGRDGFSATCLLIPSRRDEEVAAGLGTRLMGPERLQERWAALWSTRQRLSGARQPDHSWEVRLDAKPVDLTGGRTGSEHIRWNKRLLLQLQRANLLTVTDVRLERSEGQASSASTGELGLLGREWAAVTLAFPPDSPQVGAMIERVRHAELTALHRGFSLMRACIDAARCIASPLAELYGDDTERACGGCVACRRQGRRPYCPPLPLPLGAVSAGPPAAGATALDIVSGVPDPRLPAAQPAFSAIVRRLVRQRRFRYILCEGTMQRVLLDAFARALDRTDVDSLYRVDAIGGPLAPEAVRERVAVIHLGNLSHTALAFRAAHVVHLLGVGVAATDAYNRRPLEQEGARHFLDPESWFREDN